MASRKRAAARDDSISPPPPKKPIKQASTTTKSAVANFFTPASKKEKIEKLSWRVVDSTLVASVYTPSSDKKAPSETNGKQKIAAFDFDSTLITTASGKTFAKDADDWRFWHGGVSSKLKQLHEEGHLLVVVSNQRGISLKPPKNGPKIVRDDRYTVFKQKAAAVFNSLNLPIRLYAATEKDRFRKPATGMWDQLLKDCQLTDDDIDHEKSVFVGDAGGRTAGTFNGKRVKEDFSCSDRNFAANLRIPYQTPEEYFLGEAPRPFKRAFDPATYSAGASDYLFQKPSKPDIILFVGFPGAGKSTFFKSKLETLGYERINQDILKTRDKCLKIASERIQSDKSVVIDNTNPDRAVRDAWISLAKKHKVPIRCVHFRTSKEIAIHNDAVRAISGHQSMNPESREILPQLAFNNFNAKFQEPKVSEGFEEVITIDFVPTGSEEDIRLWRQYWT